MLTQKRSRKIIQACARWSAVVLVLSLTATGLTGSPALATEGVGVFLTMVIRDSTYEESIGVPDSSFSEDGWLLTNYSGSLDYGYDIVAQTDGKLIIVGAFDGTSQDFGVARFNGDGSEDLTFDGDGRTPTDFFGGSDVANAVGIQADGKIVVVGSAYNNDTVRDDFALARYNLDGTLDTSFGGDGKVTTDISGKAEYARAVVVQADQKIVVAGYSWNGVNYDFALARYTSSGELDTTFNGDGIVISDLTTRSDRAFALVLSGSALIVAGEAHNGSNYDFALARYTADGSLDASFGAGGAVLTDFASSTDGGRAVLVQPDGKIVVAGFANRGGNIDFALARYSSAGVPDASFGEAGEMATDLYGGDDYCYGILVEAGSGNLLLGGYTLNGTQNDLALVRYTASGSLDVTFSDDGKLYSDFNGRSEWGYGLLKQADGKLILAGYMLTVAGSDFAMARFTDNGSLDLEFNQDGWVITNLFGSNDMGMAAVMQPDEKLVLAGWVDGMNDTDFAVARYYSNGSPDLSFDDDGRVVTDVFGNHDNAYAAAVQPDGKIIVAGAAFIEYDDAFALVRYNTDGSLDPTFGGDGLVTNNYGDDNDRIHALLIQPDGKLVAAGQVGTTTGLDFALARYNADGSLDTSFGSGGWVVTDFYGDDDFGQALTRQPDGKLLLAGYVTNGSEYDFALVRYNADGSLDSTFSGDGRVVTDFIGDDEGHAVAWRGDGNILVAGWTFNGTDDDIAVACYTSNGSLDTVFDGDGRLVANLSGFDDHVTAIGIQPDSKLLLAGSVNTLDGNFDFVLARYLPTGILDSELNENGWLTLDFYSGDDIVQALVMQPGGQLILAGYADNGTDYDFALAKYR